MVPLLRFSLDLDLKGIRESPVLSCNLSDVSHNSNSQRPVKSSLVFAVRFALLYSTAAVIISVW